MSQVINVFLCLIVLVYAKPSDDTDKDQCSRFTCRGEGYQCIDGHCYCADGYVPNSFLNRCVLCPGLGEKCFGPCCYYGNVTLTCWQGTCQPCHDNYNNWVCHNTIENVLLVSSTQIAMASALILGVIATFVLLYKLCAATTIRSMGGLSNGGSRLSIGSLQVYVDERLRDAPPRYSRAAPSGSSVVPATVYVNAGFIHDSSIPPPPYTPHKEEENQNPTIHI